MDLDEVIRQLHEERERLDRTIAALERLLQDEIVHEGRPAPGRRGRKSMGGEERLVVSQRMRKYWAARRKMNQRIR